VRFFIKNDLKLKSSFFKPEDHPYDYNPGFPLRHGLLKNGEIDWPFWCKQETWSLDQAVRLLDDKLPGYDSYYDRPWKEYWKISDALKKVLASGGGYHIFKGQPRTMDALSRGKPSEEDCLFSDPSKAIDYTIYISHDTLVHSRPFIEWAYYNNFYIPAGLQPLLPKILKSEQPSPFAYSNLTINRTAYIAALESVRRDDWNSRRGILAHILNDLGFTARETYLALSESGKSLDEPTGDPEAIARKWRRTGRHIMETLEKID